MDTTTHTLLSYFTLGLGLLTAIGTSVSLFLHWLAPRTQSPRDDDAAAKLDELLAFLRGLPLPGAPSTTAAPTSAPSDPITLPQIPSAKAAQAGRVGTMLIAALAALGIVAATALCTGCATLRASTAAGIVAFIDCEAPALAKTATDLAPLAQAVVSKWIGGAPLEFDTQGLKSDLAGIQDHAQQCAIAAAADAIARTASSTADPASPQVRGLMARSSDDAGDQLRATFTGLRSDLGWPPVHLAHGRVL